VAPILTHAKMQGDHRHDEVLMQQEPVRFLIDGILDLRTEANQRLDSSPGIDTHPKINDDQIGKCRKIDRLSFYSAVHISLPSWVGACGLGSAQTNTFGFSDSFSS